MRACSDAICNQSHVFFTASLPDRNKYYLIMQGQEGQMNGHREADILGLEELSFSREFVHRTGNGDLNFKSDGAENDLMMAWSSAREDRALVWLDSHNHQVLLLAFQIRPCPLQGPSCAHPYMHETSISEMTQSLYLKNVTTHSNATGGTSKSDVSLACMAGNPCSTLYGQRGKRCLSR